MLLVSSPPSSHFQILHHLPWIHLTLSHRTHWHLMEFTTWRWEPYESSNHCPQFESSLESSTLGHTLNWWLGTHGWKNWYRNTNSANILAKWSSWERGTGSLCFKFHELGPWTLVSFFAKAKSGWVHKRSLHWFGRGTGFPFAASIWRAPDTGWLRMSGPCWSLELLKLALRFGNSFGNPSGGMDLGEVRSVAPAPARTRVASIRGRTGEPLRFSGFIRRGTMKKICEAWGLN